MSTEFIYMMDGKIPVKISEEDVEYATIIINELKSQNQYPKIRTSLELYHPAIIRDAAKEMKLLGYTSNERIICAIYKALENENVE